MAPTQTLDGGTLIADGYWDGSFQNVSMKPPVESLIGMILGKSGQGKSTLFQSYSGAFIFNLDLAGTSLDPCRARIWPGIDPATGNIVERGPGGELIHIPKFHWGLVQEKIDLLLQMGRDKVKGRPRVVVMDTLDKVLYYVLEHYCTTKNIQRIKQAGNSWDAWEEIHSYIVKLPFLFREAGYGFFWTAQLGDKMAEIAPDQKQLQPDRPLLTDNFFSKVYPHCEVAGIIESRTVTTTERFRVLDPKTKKPIPIPGKPGEFKMGTRPIRTARHFLEFDAAKYRNVAKKRGNLPSSLELFPARDAWDIFRAAYDKAVEEGEAALSGVEPIPEGVEESPSPTPAAT